MNAGKASSSLSSSEASSAALRRLFQYVESRFGGHLPMDKVPKVLVSRGRLQTDHLIQLVRHEATAVHVKDFYPTSAARQLGQELASQGTAATASASATTQSTNQLRNWKVSTSRGLESSDVFTLGKHDPYNVVAAADKTHRETAQNAYFEGVLQELDDHRRRRSSMSPAASSLDDDNHDMDMPQLWPLDLFRLQLDECWPSGAGLARETSGDMKRPFGGGLARIMKGPTRWRKGYIHADELGPLDPRKGLFSANIYLQLPPSSSLENDSHNNEDQNGSSAASSSTSNDEQQTTRATNVLDIWPINIRSRWDWYRNALLLSGLSSQDPEDQVRLRVGLGEPVSIAVEPGDLVLLCVQRPHAAIGFATGTRVSLQCFVQYQGLDHRLLIDS